MIMRLMYLSLGITFLMGCATSPSVTKTSLSSKKEETVQDVRSAVESVADAVTGKDACVKYCPVCGRHYSCRVNICPFDQAPLKKVQE